MPRRKIGRADVQSMRALYETDGWSSCEIAVEYGVTPQTVRRHLMMAGVTLRPASPPGPRQPARDAAIIRAYRERMPMAEMLRRFHFCTPASVYRVLRAHGIEPDRASPEHRAQCKAQGRKAAQVRWGEKEGEAA